jgi:hypothetical protein
LLENSNLEAKNDFLSEISSPCGLKKQGKLANAPTK